uniref:Uncharacterized protein n=1 Tax=Plectus sambesii TaxID=2011161 RepID=A0A914URI0_9BILA
MLKLLLIVGCVVGLCQARIRRLIYPNFDVDSFDGDDNGSSFLEVQQPVALMPPSSDYYKRALPMGTFGRPSFMLYRRPALNYRGYMTQQNYIENREQEGKKK